MTVADWKRAAGLAKRLAGDPRLDTEIGRLNHLRALTDAQAAAGQRIAEVYGRYDRAMGRRRTAASPGYEMGRDGEDHGECSAVPEMKAKCRCAACLAAEDDQAWMRAYNKLMAALEQLGRRAVVLLERLCLDDEHLLPDELYVVRASLDVAADHFGLTGRGSAKKSPGKAPSVYSKNAITSANIGINEPGQRRLPHPFDAALATLVPAADAAEKSELRASMMAFVDRWKIEARKRQASD